MKENNETSRNGFKWGEEELGGETVRLMYNISLFGIVTMNSPYNKYILIKMKIKIKKKQSELASL
jgi:hypothetical protein